MLKVNYIIEVNKVINRFFSIIKKVKHLSGITDNIFSFQSLIIAIKTYLQRILYSGIKDRKQKIKV